MPGMIPATAAASSAGLPATLPATFAPDYVLSGQERPCRIAEKPIRRTFAICLLSTGSQVRVLPRLPHFSTLYILLSIRFVFNCVQNPTGFHCTSLAIWD